MNWRRFYIVLIVILVAIKSINAQANLLNAKTIEGINKKSLEKKRKDKPLPYGYVQDRDILWSKVVWEFVDLNQKINLPYYYPIDTTDMQTNRRSLFDVLVKGIKSGKIKNIYSDSFFSLKISKKEVNNKLVSVRKNGDYSDTYTIQSTDVQGYMLKGMWYFDKRQGELKYRLLGIAPMGPDLQTLGIKGINDKGNLYELFWLFYPSIRNVLYNAKVFNPKNSSRPISFDRLLNARRFNAVIVKEENIYGNRTISDYIRGNSFLQLLEANKIKERIRNREIDMWNY